MSKELEDLINFINTLLNARLSDKHFINVANNETWLELSKIKLALLELQSIKEANPSEALECLEKLKGMEISSMPFSDECGTQEVDLNDIRKVGSQLNTDFREYTTTIKQALLKAQKEHTALDIIKKNFEFGLFETDKCKVYIYSSDDDYSVVKKITKEEFELLKEVM